MLGESVVQATAAAKSVEPRKSKKKEKKFVVGDEVLVAYGPAFSKTRKWTVFESYLYGPCRVTKPDHQQYEMDSSTGRITRQRIHY